MREYWNLYSFDLQWRILKPLHLICCHKNKSQPVVLYDFYAVLYILLKNLLSTHLHKNWTNQYWRYKNTKIIPIGERFNKKNTSCTGRTERFGSAFLKCSVQKSSNKTKNMTASEQNVFLRTGKCLICTGRTEQKGLVLLSWKAVYKKAATNQKHNCLRTKCFP